MIYVNYVTENAHTHFAFNQAWILDPPVKDARVMPSEQDLFGQ